MKSQHKCEKFGTISYHQLRSHCIQKPLDKEEQLFFNEMAPAPCRLTFRACSTPKMSKAIQTGLDEEGEKKVINLKVGLEEW